MFGPKIFNKAVIPWNGTNNATPGAPGVPTIQPIILHGEHCLVFYLGGIGVNVNGLIKMQGFSKDPTNPLNLANTTERIGPFYEFEPTRMITGPGNQGYFYAYRDRYGPVPYVYFGGNKGRNSYPGANSTAQLNGNLTPYFSGSAANPNFANADTYQIISAGRDGIWPGWLVGPQSRGHWTWRDGRPEQLQRSPAGWTAEVVRRPTNACNTDAPLPPRLQPGGIARRAQHHCGAGGADHRCGDAFS